MRQLLLTLSVVITACNHAPRDTAPMNKAAPVARVEPEPERKPDVAEPIAKLTELKDAMCKCTDKACAETTQAELVAYGQSVAGRTEKPDQATIDKAMVLMTDYQACAEKLLGTP